MEGEERVISNKDSIKICIICTYHRRKFSLLFFAAGNKFQKILSEISENDFIHSTVFFLQLVDAKSSVAKKCD